MNWRIRDLVSLAAALVLTASPAPAQEPTLATVLGRAAAYVTEFERQLSGIVAEEHYVQEVQAFHERNGCPSNATYQSTLIEPSTGRVLMSEMIAKNRTVDATIDVSFQSEPLVGMLVPIEMREEYNDRGGAHITGVATYGRFRQFTVNVDEKFLIKR